MATIKKGIVKVGGSDYLWSIFRQPTFTRDENQHHKLLGLAILVESLVPSCRELILQFDIHPTAHRDMRKHQRFRVTDGRLVEAIEGAMSAGWDPESRGKRFVYEAGFLQLR
jgi:hypothetical protein